ncbi:MAG: hypothetical protein IKL59_05320 [Clostridia bacterium]|nr:hypothetical protein [Clostridia bacterium]
MKWAYKSEMRTKAQVSDILCRERFPDQYKPDDVRGMIFANTMELAYEILSNSGNKQYFILDGTVVYFSCTFRKMKTRKPLWYKGFRDIVSHSHSIVPVGLGVRS